MDQVTTNPDSLDFHEPLNTSIIEPLSLTELCDFQSLIILNQDISIPHQVFKKLWINTKLHIAVDGGADRLLQHCQKHDLPIEEYKPDYIIGDFDSVKDETLEVYRKLQVVIIHQETQYSTDLMKALSLCNLVIYFGYQGEDVDEYDGIAKLEQENFTTFSSNELIKNKIFILGGIGGRLDQTVHSISILYKSQEQNSHLEIFYINKDFEDLIFVVPLGKHYIKLHTDTPLDKRIVGLLPFGPQVMLTTRGLKWDVTNWSSEIGTKISSSNHVVNQNGILVENDKLFIINIMLFTKDFL